MHRYDMAVKDGGISFSDYSEVVREFMRRLAAADFTDTKTSLRCGRKLLQYGEQSGDDKLPGFTFFLLGGISYTEGDIGGAAQYLMNAIPHLAKGGLWELLGRAYYNLGVINTFQGNITDALDCYLTALKYADRNRILEVSAMANLNIGCLYMDIGEYERAMEYFQKAGEYFLSDKSSRRYYENLSAFYADMGETYLRLGEYKEAKQYSLKIRHIEKAGKEVDNGLNVWIFKAKYAHFQRCLEARAYCLEKAVGIFERCPCPQIYYEDCYQLCLFLREIGDQTLFETVLEKIERVARDLELIRLQLRCACLRIGCDEAAGGERTVLAYKEFYRLSLRIKEEDNRLHSQMIQLKLSLEKIREENMELQRLSETDSVTGLPNRYKLNQVLEKTFEYACKKGISFGVELLDIDYFKQYNDTYGHMEGDACLADIGGVLKNIMDVEKDVFCARYGGDEFMILYTGKRDKEIMETAETIKRNIMALGRKNRMSDMTGVVTVTQGIRNSVPAGESRIWDYTYGADLALYTGKERERNSITLIRTTKTP